jgi:trehalose synthase
MMRFEEIAESTRTALSNRTVLNINSTATGGGVAEMLQTLLAYVRGAGVDARWIVIDGDPEFFAITKRIHNGLYGSPGDGRELGDAERRHYEAVLRRNGDQLLALVHPGNIALIHDPQPAGLAPMLRAAGVHVIWRCHIGSDIPNQWTERAWTFLRPYLEHAQAYVVSHAAFSPPWAKPNQTRIVTPSIDPFSAKNEAMSHRNVELALAYVGLIQGNCGPPPVPFRRRDGSPGRINRHVDVIQSGPPAPPGARMVVQASRWDAMKDMAGVMEGFAEHVDPALGAHLVLAGPAVTGIADDPEAAPIYDECVNRWRSLPHAVRGRIHLACMPMTDPDEAAAMVNALQRHATLVVQKSLAEGFGLTVTEAMWKARPIVASSVGGISDQIVDGRHGLLVEDPTDLRAFGTAVEWMLRDEELAAELGNRARERAITEFLGDRHLEQYAALFEALI